MKENVQLVGSTRKWRIGGGYELNWMKPDTKGAEIECYHIEWQNNHAEWQLIGGLLRRKDKECYSSQLQNNIILIFNNWSYARP